MVTIVTSLFQYLPRFRNIEVISRPHSPRLKRSNIRGHPPSSLIVLLIQLLHRTQHEYDLCVSFTLSACLCSSPYFMSNESHKTARQPLALEFDIDRKS